MSNSQTLEGMLLPKLFCSICGKPMVYLGHVRDGYNLITGNIITHDEVICNNHDIKYKIYTLGIYPCRNLPITQITFNIIDEKGVEHPTNVTINDKIL
jgi:hypothetical protein